MTDPKVSEKKMLDYIDSALAFKKATGDIVWTPSAEDKKKLLALRSAIIECFRLREKVGEWKKEIMAIFANMAVGNQKTLRKELANALMLLSKIRDFKLDGEEGK